jgi:type I restriction enzyme R subunit
LVPKLQAAGWDNDPHSIAEQRKLTKGQTVICCDPIQRHKSKLTGYTVQKVRTLCASPDELRARWADAGQRADRVMRLQNATRYFEMKLVEATNERNYRN